MLLSSLRRFFSVTSTFFILTGILILALFPAPAEAVTYLTEPFTGTTINTSEWTEVDTGGAGGTTGNVQQNGSLSVANSFLGGTWGDNALYTVDTFTKESLSVSATMTRGSDQLLGYGDYDFGTTGKVAYVVDLSSSVLGLVWNGASLSSTSCGTVTNGATYKMSLVTGGGFKIYKNDILLCTISTAVTVDDKPVFLQSATTASTFDTISITGPVAPSAITTLTGTSLDEQVALSWSAPDDGGSSITDYVVQYKVVGAGSYTTFSDGTSTSASATVTGLTNGTSYQFNVYAVNAEGNGPDSNNPIVIPAEPTFGTILSDSFTGTSIDTTKWTEVDTGGAGGTTGNVQQNGTLSVANSFSGTWGVNALYSASTFDATGLEISATMTRGSDQLLGYGDYNFQAAGTKAYAIDLQAANVLVLVWNNGSLSAAPTCGTTVSGAVYKMKIISGGFEVYQNDVLKCTVMTAVSITNKPIFLESASTASTFDNVLVYGIVDLPDAPSNITTAAISGGIFIQWVPVADATGYSIQYKPTADATWTTTTSTGPGKLISGLSNGTSYDLKVASVSSAGTGNYSFTLTETPGAQAEDPFYNQILATGQSLSVGADGTPMLTTTQPYDNKMLNSAGTAFLDLTEPSTGAYTNNAETMNSALANMLTDLSESLNFKSIVTLHGVAGTAYTGLKQGTAPYNSGLAQIEDARDLSVNSGTPVVVRAVTTIHGESDHIANTTKNQYKANLVEWQEDYDTDAKARTGQNTDVVLFTDQMSAWTTYSSATSVIPIAQLEAAQENPDTIVLVGPKYFLDYVGGLGNAHLENYAYRRLGEYYGKVMKKVLIDGEEWIPLQPNTAVRSGNEIVVTYDVPEPPLVIDTTLVDEKTNYGFEYSDSTSSATISSVAVTGDDEVTITLSAVPTGSDQRIRYAYTGTSGSDAGARNSGSARGNIRDSDPTPALYTSDVPTSTIGTTLYNWSVIFDQALTVDATAPTITSVSTTTASGSYSAGTEIPLTVTFSEKVTSTGNITLTLNTGSTCSFTITSATAASCTYTVAADDITDALSVTSIAGTIADRQNNSLTNYSIGTNLTPGKTIALSTAARTATYGSYSTAIQTFQNQNVLLQTPTIPIPIPPIINAAPFTRSLTVNTIGEDVRTLQKYLNTKGFLVATNGAGSPGKETNLFGSRTKAALIKFQQTNRIYPTLGFFGPKTRAFIQQHP